MKKISFLLVVISLILVVINTILSFFNLYIIIIIQRIINITLTISITLNISINIYIKKQEIQNAKTVYNYKVNSSNIEHAENVMNISKEILTEQDNKTLDELKKFADYFYKESQSKLPLLVHFNMFYNIICTNTFILTINSLQTKLDKIKKSMQKLKDSHKTKLHINNRYPYYTIEEDYKEAYSNNILNLKKDLDDFYECYKNIRTND